MAQYGFTIVTAPTWEPVTLTEAKWDCGIDLGNTYSDLRLTGLIKAAREKVETDTGRALPAQTWDITADLWPCGLDPIYLPLAPLSSVTHVKYYDTSNVQQTLGTTVYKVHAEREPAEIRLKNAQSWPSLYGETGVITVRIVCGYTSAAAVPESLKQAMRMVVKAEWQEQPLSERYINLVDKWRVGDEWHPYARSLEYAY